MSNYLDLDNQPPPRWKPPRIKRQMNEIDQLEELKKKKVEDWGSEENDKKFDANN